MHVPRERSLLKGNTSARKRTGSESLEKLPIDSISAKFSELTLGPALSTAPGQDNVSLPENCDTSLDIAQDEWSDWDVVEDFKGDVDLDWEYVSD